MADAAVEDLDVVWGSIAALCRHLDEEDWQRPTACEGWSVKDQVAHLVGTEAALLGRPQPDLPEVPPSWVRNDIGRMNEAAVAHRRDRSPAEVLSEFTEVTGERLGQLRRLTEEDLSADSWTPIGPGTVRDLLGVRAFDAWVHEQDIREAVGRPGHLDGPVAEAALGRCLSAMPFVVGKKAAAPEGSTVVFAVTGETAGELAISVEGRRAKPVTPLPAEPTVRLTLGFLPFTRLGCGRSDPEAALARGTVAVAGDTALGEAIVRSLAFMI